MIGVAHVREIDRFHDVQISKRSILDMAVWLYPRPIQCIAPWILFFVMWMYSGLLVSNHVGVDLHRKLWQILASMSTRRVPVLVRQNMHSHVRLPTAQGGAIRDVWFQACWQTWDSNSKATVVVRDHLPMLLSWRVQEQIQTHLVHLGILHTLDGAIIPGAIVKAIVQFM